MSQIFVLWSSIVCCKTSFATPYDRVSILFLYVCVPRHVLQKIVTQNKQISIGVLVGETAPRIFKDFIIICSYLGKDGGGGQ